MFAYHTRSHDLSASQGSLQHQISHHQENATQLAHTGRWHILEEQRIHTSHPALLEAPSLPQNQVLHAGRLLSMDPSVNLAQSNLCVPAMKYNHLCIFVYMYMYVYACMSVCIYIYIYIYMRIHRRGSLTQVEGFHHRPQGLILLIVYAQHASLSSAR